MRTCAAIKWLRIKLNDDRSVEEVSEVARGEPRNPLSPEEVETKFAGLTASVPGAHDAQQVMRTIQDLEHPNGVTKLIEFLGTGLKKKKGYNLRRLPGEWLSRHVFLTGNSPSA